MTAEHSDDGDEGRVTAPQQAYGMGHVAKGFLLLVVGLAITMGLPILLV